MLFFPFIEFILHFFEDLLGFEARWASGNSEIVSIHRQFHQRFTLAFFRTKITKPNVIREKL